MDDSSPCQQGRRSHHMAATMDDSCRARIQDVILRSSRRSTTSVATRLAVLLLPGSFNPPHSDHVRCLQAAAAAAEAESAGYIVVAALLQPSSDNYLRSKVGAAMAMRLVSRLRACDILCGGFNDAATDAGYVMGVWRGGKANGTESCADCEAFLGASVLSSCRTALAATAVTIKVLQVVGGDFLDRYGGWGRLSVPRPHRPRIVIRRRGDQGDQSAAAAAATTSADVATSTADTTIAEGWIIANEGRTIGDMSSTRVRDLIVRGEWAQLADDGSVDAAVIGFLKALHDDKRLFMEHPAGAGEAAAAAVVPPPTSPDRFRHYPRRARPAPPIPGSLPPPPPTPPLPPFPPRPCYRDPAGAEVPQQVNSGGYWPEAAEAEYVVAEGGAATVAWELQNAMRRAAVSNDHYGGGSSSNNNNNNNNNNNGGSGGGGGGGGGRRRGAAWSDIGGSCGSVPRRVGRRLALQIAGNSGRPGGACGQSNGTVGRIHDRHRTQEESVVSNWLVTEAHLSRPPRPASFSSTTSSSTSTPPPSSSSSSSFAPRTTGPSPSEAGGAQEAWNRIFRETIHGRWGLVVPEQSTSPETIQGVDYTATRNPNDYADAWVVRNASVSAQSASSASSASSLSSFDLRRVARDVTLVFSAGPNAGAQSRTPHGSVARTLNRHCCAAGTRHHGGGGAGGEGRALGTNNQGTETEGKEHGRSRGEDEYESYGFFLECVRHAMRGGLDAMVREGCDVAVLARLSCGIYAGPHRRRIDSDFLGLVNGLLREQVAVEVPVPVSMGMPKAAAAEAVAGAAAEAVAVAGPGVAEEPTRRTALVTVLRGQCFAQVVIPMLPQATATSSSSSGGGGGGGGGGDGDGGGRGGSRRGGGSKGRSHHGRSKGNGGGSRGGSR